MNLVVKNIVEDNPSDSENGDKKVSAVAPGLPVAVRGEGDDLHEDFDDEANGQSRTDVDQRFPDDTIGLVATLEKTKKIQIYFLSFKSLPIFYGFL